MVTRWAWLVFSLSPCDSPMDTEIILLLSSQLNMVPLAADRLRADILAGGLYGRRWGTEALR